MSLDNPYRAAGAFRGKAYIRREADAQLIEQIEDNQYYPYFAAPRQSGKSSLLMRTMTALAPAEYRSALVDLSPFVVSSYDDFWRQFLHEVARSANFDPTPIATEDPRDVFLTWLRGCKQRLIVFMDEIDVLLNVDCREQIFSKFRTFYNMRARPDTAELERLQFVLAGAAHSSRFIKDPRWSPFNVAIEIELEDLTMAQVSQLSAYLATAGAFAGADLTQRVFELSGGSVYLCQLVFEQLWNTAARGNPRLGAADVDAVVETIVAESPRNIHFYNIFRLVTTDARLAMLFRRLTEGQELGEEEHKELRLTGICRGASPFRNEIYARVFGPGGPLDLKVGSKQIELGKQLDAALARRDRLRGDSSDAAAAQAAEIEVRRLRREFREGTALQVGDVLGRGRYRVDEKIGQGGFATVWRAYDGKAQREVAIKVLHGQFSEDRSRRDRFFRGAWKMSELRHPGIVEVVEPYGEENGYHYFVMEYLGDGTLHAAVLDGKLAVPRILRIVAQIGEALQYAHSRALIHRDVKPTNVLVQRDTGKLTDFDLVREADITGGTKTGAMGTFLYAAPEVMSRPQEADVRADIYGLGMTAVFALHGAELAMDVIRDTDRFIDRLRCPPGVHAVLKKAVAWDREERYTSSAAFVAALSAAAEEPKAAPDPADSQSSSVAEWGALTSDSLLLGLAKRPVPAPPPMSAPGSRATARPVEEKATLAAAPAAHAGDPVPEALAEDEDDARAEAAPSGKAARVSVVNLVAMPALTELSTLEAPSASVAALASVAAKPEARPARAAATKSASTAVPKEPAIAAASEAARAPHVSADRIDAPASGSGLFHAQRRTGEVPQRVMHPPKQDPQPPQAVRSRGVPLFVMGLAACAALIFVAQNMMQPTGDRMDVPGSPHDVAAKATSRPPEAKKDPPAEAGAGLVGQAAAADEVDASAGADVSAGQGELGDGAETSGPPIAAEDGEDDSPESAGPPVIDATSTSARTTTAGELGATAGTADTSGVEVRPPVVAKTQSFDELTEEGCNQVRFGDAGKALPLLMQAHNIKPHNLGMLECLARAHMAMNRYEAAETYYLQILKVESRSRKALLGAAEANEKMTRLGNAAMYYELLRRQEPKNVSAAQFFKANPAHDTSGFKPQQQ